MNTKGSGPILFAYDGSDLAKGAIAEAGRLLGAGRDAVVLTVWEPLDVKFVPPAAIPIDSQLVGQIKDAAETTAAEGASLAEAAGFGAESATAETVPTWQGIVDVADGRGASIIVLGSHGRTGLANVLLGSVAGAVAEHSRRSVLIVHPEVSR
jgi:nucleotide-binding universal stress UspA family protein